LAFHLIPAIALFKKKLLPVFLIKSYLYGLHGKRKPHIPFVTYHVDRDLPLYANHLQPSFLFQPVASQDGHVGKSGKQTASNH
jgi:hypothetical protein